MNEKEMNGAAHAAFCTVWPHASGAQATGTSALDAALFTTHRSAPARHRTDKGKFGIKQLLSAAVRRRLQKKMPLCVVCAQNVDSGGVRDAKQDSDVRNNSQSKKRTNE